MLHDIDADYTPQYVKLARILRDKIESGEHMHLDALPASYLAVNYGVSTRVAYAALAMLAANRYVARPRGFRSFRVTWQAGATGTNERGERHMLTVTRGGDAPDVEATLIGLVRNATKLACIKLEILGTPPQRPGHGRSQNNPTDRA